MSTPEQDLQAKLAAFEATHPSEGKTLRELVAASPELNARLVEAVKLGHLDGGFATDSDPNNTGSYARGTETISISSALLAGAATNPETANTTLMTLAHEVEHAVNKDAIQARYDKLGATSQAIANGPPPRDYTPAITDFLSDARLREAKDEIAGVNALAAKIGRENPGATQPQLFQALAESSPDVAGYFNNTGTATNPVYVSKAGITFNNQFQVEPNAANVEAFGKLFFDDRGYPDRYGQRALDTAAKFENDARVTEKALDPTAVRPPAAVNLKAPGIGPNVTAPSGITDSSSPRLAAPTQGAPGTTPSSAEPNAPASAPGTGTQTTPTAPNFSPTSDRLLQDSERHVRRIAEERGLPWDKGMENTVAAVALKAREAGLSSITYLKAADGEIRFIQHDKLTNPESSISTRSAANAPAADALEKLAAVDESKRSAAGMDSAAVDRQVAQGAVARGR